MRGATAGPGNETSRKKMENRSRPCRNGSAGIRTSSLPLVDLASTSRMPQVDTGTNRQRHRAGRRAPQAHEQLESTVRADCGFSSRQPERLARVTKIDGHGRPWWHRCSCGHRTAAIRTGHALGAGGRAIYGRGPSTVRYVFCRVVIRHRPEDDESLPGFQIHGVATLCLAVAIESSTRRILSKFRPVLIGYGYEQIDLLSGPMTKTLRTVGWWRRYVLVCAGFEAGSMSGLAIEGPCRDMGESVRGLGITNVHHGPTSHAIRQDRC